MDPDIDSNRERGTGTMTAKNWRFLDIEVKPKQQMYTPNSLFKKF